jgi:hypothetical protein
MKNRLQLFLILKVDSTNFDVRSHTKCLFIQNCLDRRCRTESESPIPKEFGYSVSIL